jgi:signal transduction histidine kinase
MVPGEPGTRQERQMTEAGTPFDSKDSLARALEPWRQGAAESGERLERLHAYFLEGCPDEVRPALDDVLAAARRVREGCGDLIVGDDLASVWYAAAALIELAAALELDEDDARGAAAAVAEACALPLSSARFILYSQSAGHPRLLELPPLLAAEIQLTLLLGLDVVSEVSLWQRTSNGLSCILSLGGDREPSRRIRSEAKAVLRGRSRLSLLGGSQLRSTAVQRFSQPYAALVSRSGAVDGKVAEAFLSEAAAALSPVLEREHLLEHSAAREKTLVAASERRLMRLGFDLHDGPIQDVLALAADVRLLQQQIYPFVLEDHREQAYGRFDDLTARLVDLDRQLREVAHSLETKSVLSRPLGEILHREVDSFGERSGIETSLEIRGDPDSLSSAQRITVFRAIQEGLANVREHSGATSVDVRLRARRSAIEVQIVDDGTGFEVERALAKAAQRGRLGLVGMGERVRMLGGTFDVESRPGGPTSLKFTLPRWEPLVT